MSEREAGEGPEKIKRRKTREVRVGKLKIGGEAPIVVQSMCATRTSDVEATVVQVNMLETAGCGIVRIAVDSRADALALAAIRERTGANLSVDLQENYRLASEVAPYVDKIRYNPGHLYHHEREKSVYEKIAFLVEAAGNNDCALRIGVNCGSVDPAIAKKFGEDSVSAMVESALIHCAMMDRLGFDRFVVSLKDSDPEKVIEANLRFAKLRPEVPLHLGVTEAGLPPDGIIKTRKAFEYLLSRGIGETLRVSLTVPNSQKGEEIFVGRQIIDDVANGRLTLLHELSDGLNIISCPSCSRVENEKFVELAQTIKNVTKHFDRRVTIAVMGCRVNGPGETDDADFGIWSGPRHVNLKRGAEELGAFTYEEIIPRLLAEHDGSLDAKR